MTSLRKLVSHALIAAVVMLVARPLAAQTYAEHGLTLNDVFQLEFASDPRLAPDGESIVYVRNFMDVMTDRRRSDLWMLSFDGSNHRSLTSGNESHRSPRWSPDGHRLAYVVTVDGSTQIYLRWMDTGQTGKLTNVQHSPNGLTWSPDGRWLAFSMFVPQAAQPIARMPAPPPGATWADAPRAIERLPYRADGSGYLDEGYTHVFVLPSEGGTPRQLTTGSYNHNGGIAWSVDSRSIIVSANRTSGWELEPGNSDLWEFALDGSSVRQLTTRFGPEGNPSVSPDGRSIAYTGYDDRYQGYQVTELVIADRDGGNPRVLATELDRDVAGPQWASSSDGLYFQYDDEGNTKLAFVGLGGRVEVLAADLGGLSLGRPYSGAAFSASGTGRVVFTQSRPDHPADLATIDRGGREASRLTQLNADLLDHKTLGQVEEIWYESSFDGRRIQGWIVKPPGFESGNRYPLLLEIHGGPFANYGDRFSAEVQLFASAGYVVLYTNPRGSTSYGEEFGNLIHHAYPSQDYDDLMSGVDAVIARGYIDEDNLFVTGGSGGGVLTSWIVGKTNRFRAAVVAKPVINWFSWALTADMSARGVKYWFPGNPWDHAEHYMERSPISLVGNVTTPTMLLTGEEDYRTPMSESEQFYQALKLREVDAALVRIPGASHGIANRPSQLMAKVAYILGWFERYRRMTS